MFVISGSSCGGWKCNKSDFPTEGHFRQSKRVHNCQELLVSFEFTRHFSLFLNFTQSLAHYIMLFPLMTCSLSHRVQTLICLSHCGCTMHTVSIPTRWLGIWDCSGRVALVSINVGSHLPKDMEDVSHLLCSFFSSLSLWLHACVLIFL